MASWRLQCSAEMWRTLTGELCRRSEHTHESGAFFLGRIEGSVRQCLKVIYYDELDPEAYASGVCILKANSFGKLWKVCRESSMTIVADIHTHVGRAFQSPADRTNPMIGEKGHIALIVPYMCCKNPSAKNLCVYEYLGGHRWIDHSKNARKLIQVG